MIDPATLALIGKLIGLGLAVKKGMESDKLDENDVGALKNFLETGTELAKLWSRGKDSRAAALHLALVTRAFGKALAQYWVSPEVITPDVIERCLKRASLKVADPNRHLPDEKALALLQALSGDPSGNPYYKALWHAFFEEPVTLPGSRELVSLLGENPRLFDSYFRRAYVESLATAEGQQVQRWCLGLAAEKREVMRHILAEDIAAWGKRHVFGNVRRQAPGDPMPFLSLDDSYIEPSGQYEWNEQPIIHLLSKLLEMHKLVVVKADFGHGKSLTARRLARDVAQAWLENRQPASESPYPVFIKCARDLRDARYDHADVVRSALWHAAEDVVADRPARQDDAFAPLESEQAALFVFDGLDEVALTRNHLEDLFEELVAALGPRQHVLVFTRPGAFHDERCLPRATPVVAIQPFDDVQIDGWVERWNALSGKAPIEVARLTALGLATLARTPILLLMIAVTWGDQLASAKQVSKASLYESFFQHIARGKYEVPHGEEHARVLDVSRRLTRELHRRGILQEENPVEAMLWLMSRVAWEAHEFAYDRSARVIRAQDVDTLLRKEIGIYDADIHEQIQVGLLLVMQIDPTGASKTILFGHQSFREFLVARYWKNQLLRRVARETERDQWGSIEKPLMQARLLQDEDDAFSMLIEMLRGLDAGTRREIKEWARKCLETDELILHRDQQEDRRPVLRESALAIGSCIELDEGLQLDKRAIRFLCFWHQFHEQTVRVQAPSLRSPHAHLHAVHLVAANLSGADLSGANLSRANLERANLSRANLQGANLGGANLEETDLSGANLEGANLEGANLEGANLEGANLEGANLIKANLERARLNRAKLSKANLSIATLEGATLIEGNLRAVNLEEANLAEAILIEAILIEAILIEATLIEADLEEANLEEANLEAANLVRANLVRANLVRANLMRANLEGANLNGAKIVTANFPLAYLAQASLEGANVEGGNLAGANLIAANLAGANLREANLEEANLEEANLEEANLEDANLVRSKLGGARLVGAILNRVALSEANLFFANLERARLEGANLERVNLEGANLVGANFEGTVLERANLKGANLLAANFEGANLEGANLERVNLAGANLERANLVEANLAEAVLVRANLSEADLTGAQLRGARVSFQQLSQAFIDGALGVDELDEIPAPA